MLMLIGLGLELGDITSKGLSAIKDADKVLIERYTLPTSEDYISFLEEETGKEIEEIARKDLEDVVKNTLEFAKENKLAILVPGDPLVATTHHIVLETAAEMDIDYRVYHAPSVFTAAIGESGLDIYKFGPTTTIPFWSAKYKPVSFIDVIKKNHDNGQHTLVLLDVDPVAKRTMHAIDAIDLLEKADEKKNYNFFNGKRRILILCEVGCEEQEILYTDAGNTKIGKAQKRLEGKRTCLIIPADLSFAEEKLVSRFTF